MPTRQTIASSVRPRRRPSVRDRHAEEQLLVLPRRATTARRLALMETLIQLQAQRLILMQAQLDHLASSGRS